MQIPYAELFCLSNFSFLKAAAHPESLVQRAQALGYRALAITDECAVSGVVRAHMAARACGLHLIIGAHFVVGDSTLIVLAHNRKGYGDLSAAISRARNRAKKGAYEIVRDDFLGFKDCSAILQCTLNTCGADLIDLKSIFENDFSLGVCLHRGPHDEALIAHAESLGALHGAVAPFV